MKKNITLAVFSILFIILTFLYFNAERVTQKAKKLYGEDVISVSEIKLSNNVKILSPHIKLFYVDLKNKIGLTPNMVEHKMIIGKKTSKLNTPKDVINFLSGFKKPVKSKTEALKRTQIFAELMGGTIQTQMPKRKSMFERYQKQNAKEWTLIIKKSKNGWLISTTLMLDSAIEYCVRFKFLISYDGSMTLLSEKVIYTYTLYL